MNEHFWRFAKLVVAFFAGGMLLSMLAVQLSPAHRENVRELAQMKEDMRYLRSKSDRGATKIEDLTRQVQIAEKQVLHARSQADSEHHKTATAMATAKTHLDTIKVKRKELERTVLERNQVTKKNDELQIELDKAKKSLSKATLRQAQEKKDYDLKTIEFSTTKEEATKCKKAYEETRNKLERLSLEHTQVQNDEKELEGSVKALQKKVEEEETVNRDMKQKLTQAVDTVVSLHVSDKDTAGSGPALANSTGASKSDNYSSSSSVAPAKASEDAPHPNPKSDVGTARSVAGWPLVSALRPDSPQQRRPSDADPEGTSAVEGGPGGGEGA